MGFTATPALFPEILESQSVSLRRFSISKCLLFQEEIVFVKNVCAWSFVIFFSLSGFHF